MKSVSTARFAEKKMRIAICSLSQFTYVAEFIDAAQCLNEKHEICYFFPFSCQNSIRLLEQKHLAYQVLLDEQVDITSVLTVPADTKSTYDLFKSYFLKHAELALPYLIKSLRAWKPNLILSHLRDYAGMTAAEILDVPMVSFGSHESPIRVEGIDPPFGSGVSRDAPKRLLQFMWKLHHEFNNALDQLYNETIRQPHGLVDIRGVSTLHSSQLVLLSTISALSNKYSSNPSYIKYVGSLFSSKFESLEADEHEQVARIASSKKPRVFVSLGTTFVKPLLEKCLKALETFPGTVIVSLGGKNAIEFGSLLEQKNVISRSFFYDPNSVLNLVDAVITVTAAKTVLASLAASKPLVCVPQQGEQYERAYMLQSLGAAEVPCSRRWDSLIFARVTEQVATESRYANATSILKADIEQSGGVNEVLRLINSCFA
jgi:UDP:flavonoid glycosyltransferase YjiC (YdhE family)